MVFFREALKKSSLRNSTFSYFWAVIACVMQNCPVNMRCNLKFLASLTENCAAAYINSEQVLELKTQQFLSPPLEGTCVFMCVCLRVRACRTRTTCRYN